ncbi:MAG: A/G-specific adenine glycosylase [Chloroflexi bacterium]|nr:A/G-specific adenine glycosylase [Chloroflexota bacterium]
MTPRRAPRHGRSQPTHPSLPAPGREPERGVQRALLVWYRRSHRDLPWRHTRDPYAILVSEVMLQQTQAGRVAPKFLEFLQRFPDFDALAAAPPADVIRAWSPLGYNRRAVRLQRIAQRVVANGGHLSNTVEGLRSLDGIGDYTAAAVACFAFGRAAAVVDTNVRRVLTRAFVLSPPSLSGKGLGVRLVASLAQDLIPPNDPYDWNQAIMELGATVCLARAPRCPVCPIRTWCASADTLASATSTHSLSSSAGVPGEALSPRRGPLAAPGRVRRIAETRAPYRVESPFKGSGRYYRGRIVDRLRALSDGNALSLVALGTAIKPGFGDADLPWLHGLVKGLERDGLARLRDDRVSLP